MINSVVNEEMTVVYDPPKPKKIIPTETDLVHFDKFGMGSIIGQITNKGASAYALLPILKQKYGENSEEYQKTLLRLRQTCKAQSMQIDKTKLGREVKGIPNCWYEKDFYGSGEEAYKNEVNNHILLNKRPYFFKYLYDESKEEYKTYVKTQDYRCKQLYGFPLDTLLSLSEKDLTDNQADFVNNYYERCPLIISDSSMNLTCKHIEELDFNLKKKIKSKTAEINYEILKNPKIKYTKSQQLKILKTLKEFNKWYSATSMVFPGEGVKYNLLRDYFFEVENNADIIVNILVDYCYRDNKGNKELIWGFFSKEVFANIMENNKEPIMYPFQDEEGDIEYLGKKFKLREVNLIG